MSRWNWPLWLGFVLSIVAFISYPLFFARFPITRDVPWLNVALFAVALVLLFIGFRRAPRKLVAGLVTLAGVAIFAFALYGVLVFGREIPASRRAPHVGEKAPEFTLLDSLRRPVTLSQLVSTSPRGVLLVFYRGYW